MGDVTSSVKNILNNYDDNRIKPSLAQILMAGKLGGTGRVVILPVDQGFEHGPARSFAPNPVAYDPLYHFQMAIDAGLNAYAAPLGMLEAGYVKYHSKIPLILKMNSANSLNPDDNGADQAITASVKDALRLGCTAVGFTIYPGSNNAYSMMEEIREIAQEARDKGLAVVIWSYARGAKLNKEDETALDVISYSAHMAALLGAHIIKVKLPDNHIAQAEAKKVYAQYKIPSATLVDRVKHVVQSCFNGRRLVVFSGGPSKDENSIYEEAKAIRDGGGNGSIIGRNTFQRPKDEALKMLNEIIKIYQ